MEKRILYIFVVAHKSLENIWSFRTRTNADIRIRAMNFTRARVQREDEPTIRV